MISRILLAGGLAAGLLVPAANAATVVNADSSPHTVVASHKDGKKVRLALAGHHHGHIKCSEGTTLSLGKSSVACHATTAKVFIKNGKLVL
jgi:hypothetical protein